MTWAWPWAWLWLVVVGLLVAILGIEARRGRAAVRTTAVRLVELMLPGVLGTIAYYTIGFPLDLVVAPPLIAAVVFGRTPLGLLNFLVLQWFGVRLARRTVTEQYVVEPDVATMNATWGYAMPRRLTREVQRWTLLRWVWPLTGWWSEYRWIARRGGVR